MNNQPVNLPSLTGLRIWLALFVLLQHMLPADIFPEHIRPFYKNFASGSWGVFGFFVLSGFIMWHAYSGRSWTYRDFIVNRIARIYPVYLLGILLVCGVPDAPLLNPGVTSAEAIKSLVAEIFLIQTWGGSFVSLIPYNNPGWTLSIEMFFYLLFPFIFLAFVSKPLVTVIGIIILYAASAGLFLSKEFTCVPICVTHLFFFLAGTLTCMFWQKTRHQFPKRLIRFIPALCTLILFCGSQLHHWLPISLVSMLFAPVLYLLAVSDWYGRKTWFATSLVILGGEISYSLYILHLPVARLIDALFEATGGTAQLKTSHSLEWILCFAGLAILCSLVASWASWKYVELPMRRVIRRMGPA